MCFKKEIPYNLPRNTSWNLSFFLFFIYSFFLPFFLLFVCYYLYSPFFLSFCMLLSVQSFLSLFLSAYWYVFFRMVSSVLSFFYCSHFYITVITINCPQLNMRFCFIKLNMKYFCSKTKRSYALFCKVRP